MIFIGVGSNGSENPGRGTLCGSSLMVSLQIMLSRFFSVISGVCLQCSNSRHFLSFCVQKEEEPDVVLVKVEEVEPVMDTQSQTGLSIQEGE